MGQITSVYPNRENKSKKTKKDKKVKGMMKSALSDDDNREIAAMFSSIAWMCMVAGVSAGVAMLLYLNSPKGRLAMATNEKLMAEDLQRMVKPVAWVATRCVHPCLLILGMVWIVVGFTFLLMWILMDSYNTRIYVSELVVRTLLVANSMALEFAFSVVDFIQVYVPGVWRVFVRVGREAVNEAGAAMFRS